MRKLPYRLIATILVSVLLIVFMVSACSDRSLLNLSGGESQEPVPDKAEILAPPADGQAVIVEKSTVHVQSAHEPQVTRVDLRVGKEDQAGPGDLIRSDFPINGRLLQPWVPAEPSKYTIRLIRFDANGITVTNDLTREVTVAQASVVAAAGPGSESAFPETQAANVAPAAALQACAADTVGAPQLNVQVYIRGQGSISREILDAQGASGDGPWIVVESQATNGVVSLVSVVDSTQATVPQTQITDNNNGQMLFGPIAPGTYTVIVEARNDVCVQTQTTTTSLVAPAATPVPILQPTPTLQPSPTPTPFYPPPPPVPGVPYGPVQAELPELRPPVCDGADYIGTFTPPNNTRVTITEPDDIPARTVGGTLVHRAWRLQNTGTCTWGPGYELAFYGGRSMGSGGVAFESFFPAEPDRRNALIDGERLIAPEGLPNQVAVLELLLNAPVTPGIHQSYWRMRNPQGVYFGPIIGVTLDVVRQCDFGIYGAPVIKKFQIGRVGNVFDPVNPVDVIAERNAQVTFDWSLSNAQDYDIVVTGPTGDTRNIATGNLTDRTTVTFDEVGDYIITLYADNGPCTAQAETTVKVVPSDEDYTSFLLEINRASTSNTSDALNVNWNHVDTNVNQTVLYAQRFERSRGEKCLFDYNSWWESLKPVVCEENQWSQWTPVSGQPLPAEIVAVGGETVAAGTANNAPLLAGQSAVNVGDQEVAQGSSVSVARTVGNTHQGSAQVANIEWALCPTDTDPDQDIGIRYQMQATVNNTNAIPSWSNIVDFRCGAATSGGSGASGASTADSSRSRPPSPDFNPD
jgi:hypothetical protein